MLLTALLTVLTYAVLCILWTSRFADLPPRSRAGREFLAIGIFLSLITAAITTDIEEWHPADSSPLHAALAGCAVFGGAVLRNRRSKEPAV